MSSESLKLAQDILSQGDTIVSDELGQDWLYRAERLKVETKRFLANIEQVRARVESFNEQEKKLYKLRKQAESDDPGEATVFAQ